LYEVQYANSWMLFDGIFSLWMPAQARLQILLNGFGRHGPRCRLEKRLTLEVNNGEENRTKTKASLAKDPQVHSAAVQEKVHRKNNSLQKEIGAGSTQFLNF
jgi:hypothetical protein